MSDIDWNPTAYKSVPSVTAAGTAGAVNVYDERWQKQLAERDETIRSLRAALEPFAAMFAELDGTPDSVISFDAEPLLADLRRAREALNRGKE